MWLHGNGCEPTGNKKLLWGYLIAIDEMEIGAHHQCPLFIGQKLQAGHLAMHTSDKYLGSHEPVSEAAKIEWLEENRWPEWILFTLLSAVSFTQKSGATTFPSIFGFQTYQEECQETERENTAGFISSRHPWFGRSFPQSPHILIVPDSMLPSHKTLLHLVWKMPS